MLGDYFLGTKTGDLDQWFATTNFSSASIEFLTDTLLGQNLYILPWHGYWWAVGKIGGSSQIVRYLGTSGWVTDRTAGTTVNVSWLLVGYNSALFNYIRSSTPTRVVWKRTPLGGGMGTGDIRSSQKLSIDRNRNYVYCSTLGKYAKTAEYWRVDSGLTEVREILDGDLVRRSYDQGLTFTGWSAPSGVNVIEASTLFSLRNADLPNPDNIIVTITTSGLAADKAYSYSTVSGWHLLSTTNMIAESQTRKEEHTFIGALNPATNIVDYSSDGGLVWENRDTNLPTITATDLEFA